MFGSRRRGFPFAPFLLIAVGFGLASVVGSATGSVAGALLFLPLLALKLMFLFFIFGMMMRFVGGRFGPAHDHRGSYLGRRHPRDRRRDATPVEPTQAEKDWAKARKEARQEIDDLFPDSIKMPGSATMDE